MPRRRDSEDGSISLLTFLIGMPLVLFLIVAFLFPLSVRAVVQKPIDVLVDSYVDRYAAYGTLASSDPATGELVRLDDALRDALIAQMTVSGDDLTVSCGRVEVDAAGVASMVASPAGAEGLVSQPVGSVVGCSVRGTILSWPSVGPFMEAAPILFGGDYAYFSTGYVDQGDDPLYE